MTFCIGITNALPNKQYVFFWEYDFKHDYLDVFDVYEETNFIAQVLGIDIDLLESSPNNYHLVSYDVLTYDEILLGQRYMSGCDHYLAIDELKLYREHSLGNNLRIGTKEKKNSPRFIKRFFHNEGHEKSLEHFLWYKFFCGVPDFKRGICSDCDSCCTLYPVHWFCYREPYFLILHATIVIYETSTYRVKFAEMKRHLLAMAHRKYDNAENKLEKQKCRKVYKES